MVPLWVCAVIAVKVASNNVTRNGDLKRTTVPEKLVFGKAFLSVDSRAKDNLVT
jgi:hypothetical protein